LVSVQQLRFTLYNTLYKLQLKDYKRFKTLTNDLATDVKIPIQKQKKIGKAKQHDPPKFKNSTVMDSNVD
jgi:hypothetical protein